MSTFAGGSVGGGAQPGKSLLYYDAALQVDVTIDQSTAPIQLQQLKLDTVFNKASGLTLTGDEAEAVAANRRARIVVQGNVQNYGLSTEATAPFAVKLDADRYLLSLAATGTTRVVGENFLTATQATLSVGTPAVNQVTYTAVRGGKNGNNISITQAANGGLGAGTATAGVVVTDPITDTVSVTVQHNNATASTIAAAVNAVPAVTKFVTATNSGNGTGGTATIATMTGGQLDVLVSGNLTIQGQTTTVSTSHLVITDPIIFLNKDAVASTTSGGVAFSRGGGGNNDALWFWNATNTRFEVGYANTVGGTVNPSSLASFQPLKSAWSVYPDNAGNPSTIASHGQVFSKTVSALVELCYTDSAGTTTQITSNGAVNVGAVTGTTNLTFSINSDGAAGVSEQAALNLLSGNGGSNLYTGTFRQLSSGTYAGALTAFTQLNATPSNTVLLVGEPTASGVGRTSALSLVGTDGSSVIREARFSYAPQTASNLLWLGLTGDATSLGIQGGLFFGSLSNSNHNILVNQALSTAGAGAAGDSLTIASGKGQQSTVLGGGAAGALYLLGGDGGQGIATGGAGANTEIYGGNGGNGTTKGIPGNVIIGGGSNGPAGNLVGNVSIGTTNTATVNLGASGNAVVVNQAVLQFTVPHVRYPVLGSDPTNVASTGFAYTKTVSGNAEYFFRDSTGNVVQITSNGTVNGGGGTSTGTSSLTYEINNDAAAGVSENPVLILSGGDGASTVRHARFSMIGGALVLYRLNNSTQVTTDLSLGNTGSGATNLNATLNFTGTNVTTDSTGTLSWTPSTSTQLALSGALTGFLGPSGSAFSLSTQSNQHLVLAPNGTGQVQVAGTTLAGTNASGLSLITTSANQSITLTPNGTGTVTVGKDLIFATDATYKIGASSSTFRPLEAHIATTITLANTVLSLANSAGNLVATSSGSIGITGGSNQNITLTAQGTGFLAVSAPSIQPVVDATTALGAAAKQYTNLFLTGYAKHLATTDPATVAGSGFVYVKTVSANPELIFRDGAGNIVQITNNGAVNAGGTPTRTNIATMTNGSGGTLAQGTALFVNGSNTFGAAQANAAATSTFLGILHSASVLNLAVGDVTTGGIATVPTGLRTGVWVANDIIYLDPATSGKLTNVAPSTAGQYIVEVGTAINTPGGGDAFVRMGQQNKTLLS